MNDTEKIKKLRDATGLSFGVIKKALDGAGGDIDKAVEALKEYGTETAAKKSSRAVKEGVVEAYIHNTRKMGAMVELLCETDFVARNDEFKTLARDLAIHIAAMKPSDVEDLFSQQFVKDPSITIRDLIAQKIAKIGENIKVGQFVVFEI